MKKTKNGRNARKTAISSGGPSSGEENDGGLVLAVGGLLWRESPEGKELAVIRRIDYGDWTLPKGIPDKGESWENAVRRAAKEETGCDAELESFAGSAKCIVEGTPKVVLFWNMTLRGECAFKKSNEVDQLLWLRAKEALRRLDHPGERDLIRQARISDGVPSRWSRFTKHFWSSERRDLEDSIGPYRLEIEHLIRFRMEQNKGETAKLKKVLLWANAVRNLLDEAQEALDEGDVELGWRHFNSARHMEIYGLSDSQLKMRAQAILSRADENLDAWRKRTVKSLLEEEEGKLKSNPSREEVNYASKILQNHYDKFFHKFRNFRWQLSTLEIVAFLALVIWLIAFMPSLSATEVQINNGPLLGSVVLFGIMGASISGMLSTAKGQAQGRIPAELFTVMVTLARPVIGAVSALAIFAFLIAGLLQAGGVTPGIVLAISFAAGFSERLVMSAVEKVA